VDVTGINLVRVLLRLKVPASIPADLAWEASVTVDGVKKARMTALPGREHLVTDLAANVSKLTGVHLVGVRLELVAK
jgi:hypothetical protein